MANFLDKKTLEFREKLQQLPREDLLEILRVQDIDIITGIERIEWVFANKLNHLTWPDGTPITGRPLSNYELSLLVDEPFSPSEELIDMGISVEQQRMLHTSNDTCLWAKEYLKIKPRVYQTLILRDPSLRKVLRAGRRLGKTVSLCLLSLHKAYTNKELKIIVITPMRSQVDLIFDAIMQMTNRNDAIKECIKRNPRSPNPLIEFTNGSTIKFFTSGMRSGGKADVVRGQEAHIIILDEMDYLHPDDLESLYVMLQKTEEEQIEKILVASSTPTGRREKFYEWNYNPRYRAFWFPSYVNPYWTKADEDEFREQYNENAYRHEIEADWGDAVEGVYNRKHVDQAFITPGWNYSLERESSQSFFVMGVDWDKYGAGTNIVVLEACEKGYPDKKFANKARLFYREEIPKSDYTLTNAVNRIIELNQLINPRHIYIDRGYGEVQQEMLQLHGMQNKHTQLVERVRGVSFSEMVEIVDPITKLPVKKDIKPYMVDLLTRYLEQQKILFPEHDLELYEQLIAYSIVRVSSTGKPIFEASGSAQDHIHDALILALLSLEENYGKFNTVSFATSVAFFSNNLLHTNEEMLGETDPEYLEATQKAFKSRTSSIARKSSFIRSNNTIKRKKF